MIGSQQKKKVEKKVKLAVAKGHKKLTKEIKLTVNPELNRFSADEFLPEKHMEAERRLAKSILPD
jgi:hypothetical protein